MFEELSKRDQLLILSGIFEGEGWFGVNKRKHGWTPSASMEIQMTDKDILEKFQSYLKVYNNLIKRNKKAKEHHKTVWRFAIRGYRALHFMEEMLPYLGTRRKEQYYAVVKIIGDGPKNWSPPVSEQAEDQTSNV
jgi:mRNA-degrading endonuclease RelE of RelBE toxin-antitoxin system